jgi:hypothetical protein
LRRYIRALLVEIPRESQVPQNDVMVAATANDLGGATKIKAADAA